MCYVYSGGKTRQSFFFGSFFFREKERTEKEQAQISVIGQGTVLFHMTQ